MQGDNQVTSYVLSGFVLFFSRFQTAYTREKMCFHTTGCELLMKLLP